MVHSNGRATRASEALRCSELHEIRFLCANITSLGEPRLAVASRAVTKYWNRSRARDDAKKRSSGGTTFAAQPTACLPVPRAPKQHAALNEARKRRASERHAVGCSGRVVPRCLPKTTDQPMFGNKHATRFAFGLITRYEQIVLRGLLQRLVALFAM